MNVRCKECGFALIEAIVAIVILSMTLLATYGWINVSIDMLTRSDDVVSQELALGRLVSDLRHHDFKESTTGSYDYENLEFEWQANLMEPARKGTNVRGRNGLYDQSLYLVEINVTKLSRKIASYTIRVVHSERVRDPQFEL